jgi:hypothetical protein
MVIDDENVIGFYESLELGGKIVCRDCVVDEQITDPKQIITDDDATEKYIFCDVCGKRLT